MLSASFEIITVGLPFCAFKILAGIALGQVWLTFWGALDLVINVANLLALVISRHRATDACVLSLVVRTLKKPTSNEKPLWQELGNSIDVLLSFAIVAFMLGGGFLKLLAPAQLTLWNISVILNVLGAGSIRLSQSLTNMKQ
ncbi:hypothetical protein [Turneriella parva]|uniref:Uncharacterized protein n=1 Tax=Turneriella parva (strain ATCC BAA-1111 / DSM 21527 / NCTC 11395 / H) TaxID=869212 RepID=I4B5F0_TURPD|nr:hypothetical protein [Turneriella parva]AFM12507.1 hypothetical protein Turpa_1860 [Turneriella parva DSM 21527]